MSIQQATDKDNTSRKKSRKEVLRLKLQKVSRKRFGNHFLPRSDAGRAMLTVLLSVGLADESALRSAPWCNEAELATLKREARKIEWWNDKAAIGRYINLTVVEWVWAELFHTRPVDITDDELKDLRWLMNRERSKRSSKIRSDKRKATRANMLEAGSKRAKTARQRAVIDLVIRRHLTPRGVHYMVGFKYDITLADITHAVARLTEFEGVRNLRDAVQETARQIERDGLFAIHKQRREIYVELNAAFIEENMSDACRKPIRHRFRRSMSDIKGLLESLKVHRRRLTKIASTSPAQSELQCSVARQVNIVPLSTEQHRHAA